MQYAFVEDTKYRLQLKFGYLRIAKTRILDASTKNYNLDRNVRKLKFPYFEFLFISMNFQILKRFQKLYTLQYILNFKKIKIIVLDNLSFFVIQKNSYLILNSKKIKKQRTSFLISDKSFSATRRTHQFSQLIAIIIRLLSTCHHVSSLPTHSTRPLEENERERERARKETWRERETRLSRQKFLTVAVSGLCRRN